MIVRTLLVPVFVVVDTGVASVLVRMLVGMGDAAMRVFMGMRVPVSMFMLVRMLVLTLHSAPRRDHSPTGSVISKSWC